MMDAGNRSGFVIIFILLVTGSLMMGCGHTRAQSFPPESFGIEWLYLTGPQASTENGDDDHLQIFYLLIPDSISQSFAIRLINQIPEEARENHQDVNEPDSFEMSLFGIKNVFIPWNTRDLNTEAPILTAGNNPASSVSVLLGPVPPGKGQYIKHLESWLFRIEYRGISGFGENYYRIIAGSYPDMHPLPGAKFYCNEISFRLPVREILIPIFLPQKAAGISFSFFDMDNEAEIIIRSARRNGQRIRPSADNEYRLALLNVFSDEKNDSLFLGFDNDHGNENNITVNWLIEDKEGKDITMPFMPGQVVFPDTKKRN